MPRNTNDQSQQAQLEKARLDQKSNSLITKEINKPKRLVDDSNLQSSFMTANKSVQPNIRHATNQTNSSCLDGLHSDASI